MQSSGPGGYKADYPTFKTGRSSGRSRLGEGFPTILLKCCALNLNQSFMSGLEGESYWPEGRWRQAGSEPSVSAWPAARNTTISAASRRFARAAGPAPSRSARANGRFPGIPSRRRPLPERARRLRGRSAANGRASRRRRSTRSAGGSSRASRRCFACSAMRASARRRLPVTSRKARAARRRSPPSPARLRW